MTGDGGEWECATAWAHAKQNPYLREAAQLEPDIMKVLELARRSKRVVGYSRVARYVQLKPLVENLVGYNARQPTLSGTEHYDAAILALGALLRADCADDPDVPVESEEDGVEVILATRPILRRTTPIPVSTQELEGQWDELRAQDVAQRDADLAWLSALSITPDAVLVLDV
jgi:hypothetical protein